jgi:hypothetical protein
MTTVESRFSLNISRLRIGTACNVDQDSQKDAYFCIRNRTEEVKNPNILKCSR